MYHQESSTKKFFEGVLIGAGLAAFSAFLMSNKGHKFQRDVQHTYKTIKKKAIHIGKMIPHGHELEKKAKRKVKSAVRKIAKKKTAKHHR